MVKRGDVVYSACICFSKDSWIGRDCNPGASTEVSYAWIFS